MCIRRAREHYRQSFFSMIIKTMKMHHLTIAARYIEVLHVHKMATAGQLSFHM